LNTKQHYHEVAKKIPSWVLNEQQICDLEMLLNGAFAPLQGFLNQEDYNSVLHTMRLTTGQLWPLPITLDISDEFAASIDVGQQIALRDEEGVMLALMTLESLWVADKQQEASCIFGENVQQDSAAKALLYSRHNVYIGGQLEQVETVQHYDYRQYRHTPAELKAQFQKLGWQRIVAYHSNEPMHRLEQKASYQIACKLEANLLIHPTVGFNPSSTFEHFLRVRCYLHILKKYPAQTTLFSLINLSIRMAGAREVLCHAIIRKNYGCTHFIIDNSYESSEDNQALNLNQKTVQFLKQYEDEIDIKMIAMDQYVYVKECGEYRVATELQTHETGLSLSHSKFLKRLQKDTLIPAWFSYTTILDEIRSVYRPRYQQGFTVFFTGLSGSGKSTVANALRVKLLEKEKRPITLLDGDIVRQNLSSELSFSKQHRDLNILRIGFVASEISKNGGIAICAPIAPYESIRGQVRDSIEAVGGYIEVHISTPIEECERRDRKGLYAKARAGLIAHFTGINDPYEIPEQPELRLDTTDVSPDACAHRVLLKLEKLGFLKD
jgi:sulfate adenylyltransferase